MTRLAPYKHSDGSNCWTKNCSRNGFNLNQLKKEMFFSGTKISISDLEEKENEEKQALIKEMMGGQGKQVLLLDEQPVTVFTREKNDKTLYKTIHGSHLYGLNHATSDTDFYTVIIAESNNEHRKSKQKIVDGVDSLQVSLNRFLYLADNGSHQALEAMFSTKTVGDPLEALRKNYYVGTDVYAVYERTIRNFALSTDFKRRRHALRLTLALNEMLNTGRFNPTLHPEQAKEITEVTTQNFDEYFQYLNSLSTMSLRWKK